MQECDATAVWGICQYSEDVLWEEGNVPMQYAVTLYGEDQFGDDGCEPPLSDTRPPVCESQVLLTGRLVYVLTQNGVVPRRHCDRDLEVGEVA